MTTAKYTFLILMVGGLAAADASCVWGQARPLRSRPPEFEAGQFRGVFFDDVASMLRGKLPTAEELAKTQPIGPGGPIGTPSGSIAGAEGPLSWKRLISPGSIEDLVKGAKLRLDSIVTSAPAFASGGYAKARREFSLLAVLFSVIEVYPDAIRWKESAPTARHSMARAAANAKVGSLPVFNEAKSRLLDLGDLTRGTKLADAEPPENDWSGLVDRTPLMQLLEWSHEEQLSDLVADEKSFKQEAAAIRRYAELVAVFGKVAMAEGMVDADDDDYRAFCKAMIDAARQVVTAVETGDADLARRAAGMIGQSCADCHSDFR